MAGDWFLRRDSLASLQGLLRRPGSSSGLRPAIALPESFKKLNDHVYEVCRPAGGTPSVEIVFFHGLQLDDAIDSPYIQTWLSRDQRMLWLPWLLEEHANARIMTVSYDASPVRTHSGGLTDMSITCENLIVCLTSNRVAIGQAGCPVILVGHCIGGLVVKEILVHAASMLGSKKRNREQEKIDTFLRHVRAVFFYATPHYGSELPNTSSGLRKGPLFEGMSILNTATQRKNEDFRRLRKGRMWISAGVAENRSVKLAKYHGLIVTEGSARCDVDVARFYTDDADHFDVCRPVSRESSSFQLLSDLVEDVLKEHHMQKAEASRTVGDACEDQRRTNDPKANAVSRQKVKSDITRPDSRYVPLTGYQDKVFRALNDDTRFLVFIHGEQGIGKTSLTWHIGAELLKSNQNGGKRGQATNSATSSRDSSGNAGTSSQAIRSGNSSGDRVSSPPAFDYVFRIRCGLSMNSDMVRKELKSRLKPQEEADDIFHNIGTDEHVLLILDDVQDRSIPKMAMELAGNSKIPVNILVTSNNDQICKSCDPRQIIRIDLKTVDREDARKILANHVGLDLSNGQLPKRIVNCMDEILESTRGNPLALSCLASYIPESRAADESAWGDARTILRQSLQLESREIIYEGYPTGFWGMMRFCMERLEGKAGQILLLFCNFKDKSPPQKVLQLLYVQLGLGNEESFQRAVNDLERKHLIYIRCVEDDVEEEDKTILDIHPLRRLYIEKEGILQGNIRKAEGMIHWIEERLRCILNWENIHDNVSSEHVESFFNGVAKQDDAILVILCGVFLEGNNVLSKMDDIQRRLWPFSDENYSLLMLLALPLSPPEWSKDLQMAAKKMILSLVSRRIMNEQDYIPLVRSKASLSALIRQLLRLFTLETHYGFDRYGVGAYIARCIIPFILVIVGDRLDYHMGDKLALKALVYIYGILDYSVTVSLYLPIIEWICQIVNIPDNVPLIQVCWDLLAKMSLSVFGTLAINQQPRLIILMMNLGCKSSNEATYILRNIARTEQGCKLIGSNSGEKVLKLVKLDDWEHDNWEHADDDDWMMENWREPKLERVGYILTCWKSDTMLIERYLTDIFQTIDKLCMTGKDHMNDLNMELVLERCLYVLCRLAASSNVYCKLLLDKDRLGVICKLIDIYFLTRKPGAVLYYVLYWLKLMGNLALHDASKILLQPEYLLQPRLLKLLTSWANRPRQEKIQRPMSRLPYADTNVDGTINKNADVNANENLDKDVEYDTDGDKDDTNYACRDFLNHLHMYPMKMFLSTDDGDWERGFDLRFQTCPESWLDDVLTCYRIKGVFWRNAKRKRPTSAHCLMMKFLAELCTFLGVLEADIWTFLDGQQERQARTRQESEMEGVKQILTSLNNSKARTIAGDFSQASEDLHRATAFNKKEYQQPCSDSDSNSNFNFQLLSSYSDVPEGLQGEALDEGIEKMGVETIITRKQCYLMTMSWQWEKALEQADQLGKICPEDGYFQRGIIHKTMGIIHKRRKEYKDALSNFNAALQLALTRDGVEPVFYYYYFSRRHSVWPIVKQKAHVKYLVQDSVGAEKHLLDGAIYLWDSRSPDEVSHFDRDFFYLPRCVEYLEHIPMECVDNFLRSDDFYQRFMKSDIQRFQNKPDWKVLLE